MHNPIQSLSDANNMLCTSDAEMTGKYLRDGVEAKSSEESLDEEKQRKLWQLTGGYAHLDGFEPLDVPPPPAEPAPEEQKSEPKAEEANGEAAKETEETPVITDSNKTDETKNEDKGAGESVCRVLFSTAVVFSRVVVGLECLGLRRFSERLGLVSMLSLTSQSRDSNVLVSSWSRRHTSHLQPWYSQSVGWEKHWVTAKSLDFSEHGKT